MSKNGKKVMFEAYSKLRPGDALVRRNSSNGHAIMVYSANELLITVIKCKKKAFKFCKFFDAS